MRGSVFPQEVILTMTIIKYKVKSQFFWIILFVSTFTQGNNFILEVLVAQLAERSLTIPEDLGSIPVIGNFYWTFIYC